MSEPTDGGPAFPHNFEYPQTGPMHMPGMSLRDWFAGMALQGLLASGHFTSSNDGEDGAWMTSHEDSWDEETGENFRHGRRRFDFPEAAWKCADAMLEYRDGKEVGK